MPITYTQETMDSLIDSIKSHQKAYYEGTPSIPDDLFDALLLLLKMEERQYPQFARADSPSHTVGH